MTWRVEGSGRSQAAVVRVEQLGRLFDFPLTVSLQLADGTVQDALLRVGGPAWSSRPVPLPAGCAVWLW